MAAYDLDMPLLKLSAEGDYFRLRDACTGVHVLGGIGSGKTSGPGKAFASAYVRAQMGGVVFCAKPEEVALWERYARENGRSNSVIFFDERQGFNFITYELARHGAAGIGAVNDCLMRVLEASDHATGITGHSGDPFWAQSSRQFLNYVLPVVYMAHGEVTVNSILEFISSAATQAERYSDPEWCQSSFAAMTLRRAADTPAVPMDAAKKLPLLEYWFRDYPAIPEKTRGNIVISLSAKLDRFRHGRLQEAFCGKTTVLPEMMFQGAIIVMAMPALTWNEDGIVGQQLFKFMCQRAIESRNALPPEQQERPVFLWADESQYFVNVNDDAFLSTCRASRACVVFLTQTLPSYYARLGKERSDAADGLVGKFATQIFCQSACNRTNTYASQLIGRGLKRRESGSTSTGTNLSKNVNEGGSSSYGRNSGGGGSSSGMGGYTSSHSSGSSSTTGENYGRSAGRSTTSNETEGWSEQMDAIVEPNFFASGLQSGGPLHQNMVTAVLFRAGANFAASGGRNYMLGTFQQ